MFSLIVKSGKLKIQNGYSTKNQVWPEVVILGADPFLTILGADQKDRGSGDKNVLGHEAGTCCSEFFFVNPIFGGNISTLQHVV